MSEKRFGIETKCLCLRLEKVRELLYYNKDTVKDFDFTRIKELEDIKLEEVGMFCYKIKTSCLVLDFIGDFSSYERRDSYMEFNNEEVLLIELEKDNLFNKYKNIEEVYKELQHKLEDVGIYVDIEFIKTYFGNVNGTFFA